jgi:hypothetical protein
MLSGRKYEISFEIGRKFKERINVEESELVPHHA